MENLPPRGAHRAVRPGDSLPSPATGARRTARERIGLAVLAVERAGRGALARMRRSRLLRWRYRSPAADELLLAPPDLRGADASFADEAAAGSFGLAGFVADLNGGSPFAIPPLNPAWARELHGFGWLRHLDAAQSGEARAMAQQLVSQWIRSSRRQRGQVWAPDVVGRRVVSWLSHAGVLLDGAEPKRYAAIMASLTDQVTYLAASWRNAPDGHPRLLALIGLVHADLCIADHDHRLAQSQKLLAAELERQILPDGGHLSRNPSILIELLLDLLPLRQCFAVRGQTPQPWLLAAIGRMTAMLRHLRLGDGALARFNGVGATERDALASVLAYGEGHPAPPEMPIRSGYARLQRGGVVVLVDAGAPPPLELAGAACAGCLSFELGTGSELLLVNGGTPASAEAMRAVARATASHNTLCLGEQSSAKLMRNARLERAIGSALLRHPDRVACEVRQSEDGAVEIEASHDGYAERYGLIHTRTLKLDAAGTRLDGCDRLAGAKGIMRFAWDVPLAVHFHVHPDVEVRLGASPEAVALLLEGGEQWRLTATGATASIEASQYCGDTAGVRRSRQVVLRAQCYGATEVRWTLQRIKAGRPADPRARKRRRAPSPLSARLAETSAGFEPPRRGSHS